MSSKDRSAESAVGEIRVRSNICTDANAVHLVPWAIARTYWPERRPTGQQKEEADYLWPCSLCERKLFEIHEDGCDHHVCRGQGVISVAEATLLKEERKTLIEHLSD